tara:strand:- start:265 stop:1638 length:1374 start_codon:yes stop_codon:yes gene_type:complete
MSTPTLRRNLFSPRAISCELESNPMKKKFRMKLAACLLSLIGLMHPFNTIVPKSYNLVRNTVAYFAQSEVLDEIQTYFSDRIVKLREMSPSEKELADHRELGSYSNKIRSILENPISPPRDFRVSREEFESSDGHIRFLKNYLVKWDDFWDKVNEKAYLAVAYNHDINFFREIGEFNYLMTKRMSIDTLMIDMEKAEIEKSNPHEDTEKISDESLLEDSIGKYEKQYNTWKDKVATHNKKIESMVLGSKFHKRFTKESESLEEFLQNNPGLLNDLNFEEEVSGVIQKSDEGYELIPFEYDRDEKVRKDLEVYKEGDLMLGPLMLVYIGDRIVLQCVGKSKEEIRKLESIMHGLSEKICKGWKRENREVVVDFLDNTFGTDFTISTIPHHYLEDPNTICTFSTRVEEDGLALSPFPQERLNSFLYGTNIIIGKKGSSFVLSPYYGNRLYDVIEINGKE